jgi:ankyrin repeat protein
MTRITRKSARNQEGEANVVAPIARSLGTSDRRDRSLKGYVSKTLSVHTSKQKAVSGSNRGLNGVSESKKITSQFEPRTRASHGLLQFRARGDKKIGLEVCSGAWTGGSYGLLHADPNKRKRQQWESSDSEEEEDEQHEEPEGDNVHRQNSSKNIEGMEGVCLLENDGGEDGMLTPVVSGGHSQRKDIEHETPGDEREPASDDINDDDDDGDDIQFELGGSRSTENTEGDHAPNEPTTMSLGDQAEESLPCSSISLRPPSLPIEVITFERQGKHARRKQFVSSSTEERYLTTMSFHPDRLVRAILDGKSEVIIRDILSDSSTNVNGNPASSLPPPLVCACQEDSPRNTNIVSMLLGHGADVNKDFKGDGSTPLIQSVKTGNSRMVELLLSSGADISRVCKNGCSAVFFAIELGKEDIACRLVASMTEVDEFCAANGRTLLMEASSRGQVALVESLVNKGANVDLVDDNGQTALMTCLSEGISNKKILRLVMTDVSVSLCDALGTSPLELAITNKLRSAAEMLVDAGCDLGNLETKKWKSPLIHAILNQGGTSLVRKMLLRGACAECKSEDGKSALMHAAHLGEAQMLHELLQAGADPFKEQKGGKGWTALMYSAQNGSRAASALLMDAMGICAPPR